MESGGLPGLPLLILHVEADDYVPPAMARELAEVKCEDAYTRRVKDFYREVWTGKHGASMNP